MAKILQGLCLMLIVASSVIYEAQGHFLLKLYLKNKFPRTCSEFTPYANKGILTLVNDLEIGCPATAEFKNFFTSFKSYMSFIETSSSSKNIDAEIKTRADGLFKTMSAMSGGQAVKSTDAGTFKVTFISMAKTLVEQKKNTKIMTIAEKKKLVTDMVKWSKMLATFVQTASHKKGKTIDIKSFELDVDVNDASIVGNTEKTASSTKTRKSSSSKSENESSESKKSMSSNVKQSKGGKSSGSFKDTTGSASPSGSPTGSPFGKKSMKENSKKKESSSGNMSTKTGSESSTKTGSGTTFKDTTGSSSPSGSPIRNPSGKKSTKENSKKKESNNESNTSTKTKSGTSTKTGSGTTFKDTTGSASPSGSPAGSPSGKKSTKENSKKKESNTEGTKTKESNMEGTKTKKTNTGSAKNKESNTESSKKTTSTATVKQVESETSKEAMTFIMELEKKYAGKEELKMFFEKLKASMAASATVSSKTAKDYISGTRMETDKLSEAMALVSSRNVKSAKMKSNMETCQDRLMRTLKELQGINSKIVNEKTVSPVQQTEIKETITKWEQVTTQFVETFATSSSSSSSSSSLSKQSSGTMVKKD